MQRGHWAVACSIFSRRWCVSTGKVRAGNQNTVPIDRYDSLHPLQQPEFLVYDMRGECVCFRGHIYTSLHMYAFWACVYFYCFEYMFVHVFFECVYVFITVWISFERGLTALVNVYVCICECVFFVQYTVFFSCMITLHIARSGPQIFSGWMTLKQNQSVL